MTKSGRPAGYPDFQAPPVTETILSVQFDPIPGMTTAHIGLLWKEVRGDFPKIEEHGPLDSAAETFEPNLLPDFGVRFVTIEGPPMSRLWLVANDGKELIQVQRDRFVHNWRRLGDDAYPHYEGIRDRFRQEIETFSTFLRDENLSGLQINQCEVTYINHIQANSIWQRHGEAHQVLTVLRSEYSDGFLQEPEDLNLNIRYRMSRDGKPIGRLHVRLQPAYSTTTHQPMFILTLTARGRPLEDSMDGAFGFLNLGREWIVKGFTSITTQQMHRFWGRHQ